MQVCRFLPSPLDQECEVMITVSDNAMWSRSEYRATVQEYTDDIIELLVDEFLQPGQVCARLNLCSGISGREQLVIR